MAAARCRVEGIRHINILLCYGNSYTGSVQYRSTEENFLRALSINCIKILHTNNLHLHCFVKKESTISHLMHRREKVQRNIIFCQ